MEQDTPLARSLREIHEALGPDGFTASITAVTDDAASVVIRPLPGACSECLAPLPVLRAVLLSIFYRNGLPLRTVDITILDR